MHVIISHQQVIFTISFYKFFNDMYFTHVIFLLGQMWVGTPKMKSGYHRTTPNSFTISQEAMRQSLRTAVEY